MVNSYRMDISAPLFSKLSKPEFSVIQFFSVLLQPSYTPGIYADGYIVFAFPFVCSFVRSFVRSFLRS